MLAVTLEWGFQNSPRERERAKKESAARPNPHWRQRWRSLAGLIRLSWDDRMSGATCVFQVWANLGGETGSGCTPPGIEQAEIL